MKTLLLILFASTFAFSQAQDYPFRANPVPDTAHTLKLGTVSKPFQASYADSANTNTLNVRDSARIFGRVRIGNSTTPNDENMLVKFTRTDSLPYNQYNIRSTYDLETNANQYGRRVGGVLGEFFTGNDFYGIIDDGVGLYGYVNNNGNGTVNRAATVLSYLAHRSSHIMGVAAGFDHTLINEGGGIIDDAYGIIIRTPTVSGGSTTLRNYALYIQDQTAAGIGLNVAMLQEGVNDRNYIEGIFYSPLRFAASLGMVAATNDLSLNLSGGDTTINGANISLSGGDNAGGNGAIYVDYGDRSKSLASLTGADYHIRLNHDGIATQYFWMSKKGDAGFGPDTSTGLGIVKVGSLVTGAYLRIDENGNLKNIGTVEASGIYKSGTDTLATKAYARSLSSGAWDSTKTQMRWQMTDYFKNGDALSASTGFFTGDITLNGGRKLLNTVDNLYTSIYSSTTYANGSYMDFYGGDYTNNGAARLDIGDRRKTLSGLSGTFFRMYVQHDGTASQIFEIDKNGDAAIAGGLTLGTPLASTYIGTHAHAWGDITSGVPTTLSGYGITDTKTISALGSPSSVTTPGTVNTRTITIDGVSVHIITTD